MNKKTLDQAVRDNVAQYFDDLGDLRESTPVDMYEMLLTVVEKPLLELVMVRADGNQSTAAQWLGLNRNTLRKKLQAHKLLTGR